jgi:hypothetical protein
MPQDLLKIRIRYVQEFEEEVFQVYFVMGLREAKAGGRFQGASAGIVQFSNQGFEVGSWHGGASLFQISVLRSEFTFCSKFPHQK